jgi:diguanylate cyclase (GGDEF)-like protein
MAEGMRDFKSIVRIRLVVFLAILISLAPFSVSQILVARENMRQALSTIEHGLNASVVRVRSLIESSKDELVRLSETMAIDESIDYLSPEHCQKKMLDLIHVYDKVERISVMTPDGRVYCSTEPAAIGMTFADRQYYKDSLVSNGVVWSDFLQSRVTGRLVLQSARAVRQDGQVTRIHTVALALSTLKRATMAQFEFPLSEAELIDVDGKVLDGEFLAKGAKGIRADVLAKALRSDTGVFASTTDTGEPAYIGVVDIPGSQGRIVVEAPVGAVHDKARHDMLLAMVLTGFQTLVVAALVMAALEFLILRSLRHVIDVARRISEGDEMRRVSLTSPLPEFNVLQRTINMMVDKLEKAVLTDVLTDIANRRALDGHLENSVRRLRRYGTGFTVVMIDVDYFKRFNDAYGHSVGDVVLRQIGEKLEEFTRRPDEIAARYGGEEFTLVLTETDPEKMLTHLERLRSAIEKLAIPHDHSRFGVVTISIGYTTARPGESGKSTVSRADSALYLAKTRGRNRVDAIFDGKEASVTEAAGI